MLNDQKTFYYKTALNLIKRNITMSEVLEILKKDSSNLTDEQTKEFEQGFLVLKKEFETADIDDLNNDEYKQEFAEKFDKLMQKIGYDEFELDSSNLFLYDLYKVDEYEDFMGFIAVSYQVACGDDDVLREIYEEMHEKLQNQFDDE